MERKTFGISLVILIIILGGQFFLVRSDSIVVIKGNQETSGISTAPQVEWKKTYGDTSYDERAYSLVQTKDGGYALAGWKTKRTGMLDQSYFWLVKTDAGGNQQWAETYGKGILADGAYSVIQTADGGFALAGVMYGYFCLIKTDLKGSMEWGKTYSGGFGDSCAQCVIQTTDGGYMLAGSYGIGGGSGFLVKVDASGTLEWGKTYSGVGLSCFYSIVQCGDGGYAVAGSVTPGVVNEDFWLVKIDSMGNSQWNKTYGGPGLDRALSIFEIEEGDYVMAGSYDFGDYWLVKTDSLGNMLWNQTCYGTTSGALQSCVRCDDGGYALVGPVLVKADSMGNFEWAADESGNAIVQTSDGGYAIAGDNTSFDSQGIDHDFTLVKFAGVSSSNHSPSTPDKPQWADTEQILTPTQSVRFTTSATDPDGDQVRITYDWGDGTPTWQSNLVPSGTAVTKDHSWSQTGMFEVKAMATDSKGAESDWSLPLDVTVVVRHDPTNWSGYSVKHAANDVTYVEGQWTQPNYNYYWGEYGSTATWIGIGGAPGSSSLLQAGIGYFGPWPGMHPFWMTTGPPNYASGGDASFSANAGDLIQTSISFSGNNQWTIYVYDLTGTGWTYHATVNYSPDQNSAEWIHEIAAMGSPLIGFSPVTFSVARFTASGTTHRAGDEHSGLTMTYNMTGGVPCTTVSEISNYETFTISDTGNRPVSSSTPITSIFSLHSSAEMYVYDSQNRYNGYNVTSGFFDLGIPNSYFFVDANGTQWAVLFGLDKYRVVLNGTENGDFHLHVESYVNSIENTNLWENGTITIGATRTYYVNTISEFPTSMILPFFIIAMSLAALILRRKRARENGL